MPLQQALPLLLIPVSPLRQGLLRSLLSLLPPRVVAGRAGCAEPLPGPVAGGHGLIHRTIEEMGIPEHRGAATLMLGALAPAFAEVSLGAHFPSPPSRLTEKPAALMCLRRWA